MDQSQEPVVAELYIPVRHRRRADVDVVERRQPPLAQTLHLGANWWDYSMMLSPRHRVSTNHKILRVQTQYTSSEGLLKVLSDDDVARD